MQGGFSWCGGKLAGSPQPADSTRGTAFFSRSCLNLEAFSLLPLAILSRMLRRLRMDCLLGVCSAGLWLLSNTFFKEVCKLLVCDVAPRQILRYLLTGKGMFSSAFAEAGGFTKTLPDLKLPDFQFHFYPSKIKR